MALPAFSEKKKQRFKCEKNAPHNYYYYSYYYCFYPSLEIFYSSYYYYYYYYSTTSSITATSSSRGGRREINLIRLRHPLCPVILFNLPAIPGDVRGNADYLELRAGPAARPLHAD